MNEINEAIELYKEQMLGLISEVEAKRNSYFDQLEQFSSSLETTIKGRVFKATQRFKNLEVKTEIYDETISNFKNRVANFSFEDDGNFEEYVQIAEALERFGQQIDEDVTTLEGKLWYKYPYNQLVY